LVALAQRARFLELRDQIVAERERMAAALATLPGVTVFSSGANFLLIRLERPKQLLLHHLQQQHRVLISDMAAYPELVDYVRVSLGAPAQNDLVIQGFREVMGAAPQ
jgi:histidinol-phosphate aminotransferase